ncbi:uncharacterized protein RCO7_15062 [Rhynchosporium graminicola]|uniref:Uncharacterized protein n=2 Tax=Rhynchosporium TaxID=38037 RepID=A0A1E1M3B3_RHYSE|nr:uncharacterized protein RCO7_15062 [Rhynchosporium commune]CZT43591.1 uncharacterized protein RSE6_03653 [Rhynchosporium secalis]
MSRGSNREKGGDLQGIMQAHLEELWYNDWWIGQRPVFKLNRFDVSLHDAESKLDTDQMFDPPSTNQIVIQDLNIVDVQEPVLGSGLLTAIYSLTIRQTLSSDTLT